MASRIQAKSAAGGDPAPDVPDGLPADALTGPGLSGPGPRQGHAEIRGRGRSFRRRVGRVRRRGHVGRIRDGRRGGKGGRFREDGRPGGHCRFLRGGEGGRDRAPIDFGGGQESEVDHLRGRLRGAGECDDHRRPDEEVQEEGRPCPFPGGSARPAPRHGDALLLPHHRSCRITAVTGLSHTFPGAGGAGAPRRGGRAPR